MMSVTKALSAAAVIASVAAGAIAFGTQSQANPNHVAGFNKHASGLTYGSAMKAQRPDEEPDLILVVATNARQGYVYKSALDEAAGSNVGSPEEALAWQARTQGTDSTIPVYEADGKTKIGQFVLHHQTAAERAASPGAPGR